MSTFNPNITQLKKQAKDLRRAVNAGESAAVSRVRTHLPDLASTAPESFTLRDAQWVIAREEGHDGWHDLVEAIGEQMVDERDLHRWLGVNLNNATWQALDTRTVDADSPEHEKEALLYRAFASAYHWMQIGTPINQARGEHLIATTATRVGRFELSLHHATRCLELVTGHPDLAEDWDLGFAHEALARAHAATGDHRRALEHHTAAEAVIDAVTDSEDKAILRGVLDGGEWFGLF